MKNSCRAFGRVQRRMFISFSHWRVTLIDTSI
jgi:hypothetical protein